MRGARPRINLGMKLKVGRERPGAIRPESARRYCFELQGVWRAPVGRFPTARQVVPPPTYLIDSPGLSLQRSARTAAQQPPGAAWSEPQPPSHAPREVTGGSLRPPLVQSRHAQRLRQRRWSACSMEPAERNLLHPYQQPSGTRGKVESSGLEFWGRGSDEGGRATHSSVAPDSLSARVTKAPMILC